MLASEMAALDWSEIKAPSTARVTALTAVGKTLMAGTDQGSIFRSGDGGESWTKSNLPAGYPVLSFSAYGDTVRAMCSNFYYPHPIASGTARPRPIPATSPNAGTADAIGRNSNWNM